MEFRYALQIEASLIEGGIEVCEVVPISYGQQIKLECGLRVNVYTTGKVFVQGKLNYSYTSSTLDEIKEILPPNTKWGISKW